MPPLLHEGEPDSLNSSGSGPFQADDDLCPFSTVPAGRAACMEGLAATYIGQLRHQSLNSRGIKVTAKTR
jgi:hypothetical protein